ncbi:MAG TPA: cupin domain-containing protein [Kofleriaceae bacterium]|nr:cupin domain-containing protein [Kofleriaceae bacterium]
MKRALLASLLLACGHAKPTEVTAAGSGSGSGSSVKDQLEGSDGEEAKPDPDELRIAAIERAMNALAPVANGCWAAAAVDDFHLSGDVKMMISFDDAGRTKAAAESDTTKDPVLLDCLARVLEAYAWPKDVMHGEAVELPFSFTAPRGQNTIDRRLVPGVVKVLLDAQNSGNAAASMIEVALDPGASKEPALATRDEIVIFLDDGSLSGTAMHALDAAYVAKGRVYQLKASETGTHVLFVAVPGGAETAARGGTLPDEPATKKGKPPEIHAKAKAKRYPRTGGATTILIENAPHVASADIIEMDAGAKVPEHVHEKETELLYVLSGSGTMTVEGVDMPIGPTTVVQIPPNTPHAFVAADAVTALQLYAPPGPEQRFKKMK